MVEVTRENQEQVNSLNGKLVFEQDENRITGRDLSNKIRLLINADGDSFVMKVAKAGFDATTATNQQLIFNSSQNIFKIVAADTVNIPLSGSGPAIGTAVVQHNLQYSPLVFGTVTLPASGASEIVQFPGAYYTYAGGLFRVRAVFEYFAADTNSLTLQIRSDIFTAGESFDVKYWLLQETAN